MDLKMTFMPRTQFATTTRGLQRDTPPMHLFEKAKRYGVWNPSEIDLTHDRIDWARLTPDEQDAILRLTAVFQSGEEAVTLDLLPLIMAVAREGRIEEEMYLTSFLWEEAKHTDFFNRWLLEVPGARRDLSSYHTESYRAVFYDALPAALERLRTDSSPAAQVQASVTYNMIVEGVLAETGYHIYYNALRSNDLMPGTTSAVDLLKQDESRHIAYGIFLLSRLIAEDGSLWDIAEATMSALLMPALGVITEAFACYDPMPFGLKIEDFTNFAMLQYQKRYVRLERARGSTLDEVYRVTQTAIDSSDA
jgi:ribonucleoside-diphosphate reductase beta chain